MSWVWFGENPPVVQFSAQPQLGVTGPVGGREGRRDGFGKREESGRIFGIYQSEHVGGNGSNKSPASAPPTLVCSCFYLPLLCSARQHLLLSSPPSTTTWPTTAAACCSSCLVAGSPNSHPTVSLLNLFIFGDCFLPISCLCWLGPIGPCFFSIISRCGMQPLQKVLVQSWKCCPLSSDFLLPPPTGSIAEIATFYSVVHISRICFAIFASSSLSSSFV